MSQPKTPRRELSAPPPHPVKWTFRHKQTGSKTTVEERTWFAARSLACIALGAAPEEIEQETEGT